MSPPNYRYYCLDSTGKLQRATTFYAVNDKDAIAKIEAKHPDDRAEIWQAKRLVAVVGRASAFDPLKSSIESLSRSKKLLEQTASMIAGHHPPHRKSV